VDYRIEHDTMGEMRVPKDALYGAQTQRAVENFPISGLRFPRSFIRALGLIKSAAARANTRLKQLPQELAAAIERAADQVTAGDHDDQFVVDIFQTGSGTSTNMNANEVIGHIASAHPNDHVNRSQSSNDVIPSAIHIAAEVAGVSGCNQDRPHAPAGCRTDAAGTGVQRLCGASGIVRWTNTHGARRHL
jgi:fumarate hydratase class II